MKTMRIFVGAMLGAIAVGMAFAADAGGKTAARVEVIFSQPEKFTDVRDAYTPSEMGRNAILDQIRGTGSSRRNCSGHAGDQLSCAAQYC